MNLSLYKYVIDIKYVLYIGLYRSGFISIAPLSAQEQTFLLRIAVQLL